MFASGTEPGCDRSDPASPASNLKALRDGLGRIVDSLDADDLTLDAAVALTEAFAGIERLATAGKVLCAARAQQADARELGGHRTAGRWLAAVSGSSVAEADELLTAAAQADALPATKAALQAGKLSGAQLRAVTDGAAADRAAEAQLLATADTESLFALRRAAEVAKARARSAEEDAARHARAHARRALRCGNGGDATFVLDGHGSTVDGLTITRALRLEHERLFREAAARGERPTYAALSWDALVSLAQRRLGEAGDTTNGDTTNGDDRPAVKPVRSGAAVKTIVRVDYETLCRSRPVTDEVCEVAGVGPLPVAAVREILADPDTFLAAVLTKGRQVVGVAHLGRGPNAHQRTALEWLYPTCSVQGCDNTILDYDHDVDYSVCHETALENMRGKCGPHHGLKTHDGWRTEPGTGKRRILPPGHPDHPGPPRARGHPRGSPP